MTSAIRACPATLGSADTRGSHDLAKIHFLSGRPSSVVDAELRSGDNAVVSEPFANKHHVRAGDSITLPLGEARVSFRVVDVFYDYGSEKGFIVVERSTLLRYLPDPAPSSLAVYVATSANVDDVRAEVRESRRRTKRAGLYQSQFAGRGNPDI